MKKNLILSFFIYFFLFLWVIVWSVAVGLAVYFGQSKSYYILLIIVVLCGFNLGWWTIVKKQKRLLDNFTTLSFCFTLNLPAYICARFYKKRIVNEEILNHGSAASLDLEFQNSNSSPDYLSLLPEWEANRIKEKNKHKKQKHKRNSHQQSKGFVEDNLAILLQTYNQFLLTQILKENPNLYDTYEINLRMKRAIGEQTLDLQNLEKFIAVADEWTTFDYQSPEQLKAFFLPLSPEQIFANHKLNRVDNIIFVRHKLSLPFE